MYSRNIASLLALFLKDGKATLDMSDEVIKGTVITQGGQVVNDAVKKLLTPAAAST
jgi:NAD(P) transhydrogenase subunit alpha